MIVWQMLAALGLGGILGAGGVSWWVAGWPGVRRRPALARGGIIRSGGVSVVGEDGPEEVDLPLNHLPRMTYIRGPVRGRDSDGPPA